MIEKGEEDHGCEQARPDGFHSLFLARFAGAIASPSACRYVVWQRSRRSAVSLRRNERASLSRRRSGVPSRSFLPQQKRRCLTEPYKSGNPQSLLCVFAQQTEKGA
ncbi:MAG: hypothetical protein IJA59_02050, partial [Clostridia bacterium]|nr:hypothetical protein [Clostridia bacterium]